MIAKRTFGILLVAILLSTAALAQRRTVTIVTEPQTTVWLDGVRFGQTGADGRLSITTVSEGSHIVKLRSDGFKDKTAPVAASAKGDLKVSLVKTTDKAELKFQEAERLSLIDRTKAIAAYKQAIALRPGYADAYIAAARLQSDNGDVEEALKTIETVKRLRPGLPEASAVEARILKDSGYETKAIDAFKRAITEGRGFQAEAYTGLGLLYKEKAETAGGEGDFDAEKANYDQSASYLKTAIKQLAGAPDAIVVYQLLGLIYEREHRLTEAIALYREFLTIFPSVPEADAVRSFIVQLQKQQDAQPPQ